MTRECWVPEADWDHFAQFSVTASQNSSSPLPVWGTTCSSPEEQLLRIFVIPRTGEDLIDVAGLEFQVCGLLFGLSAMIKTD